jgi:hypothetical protein
MPYSLAVQPIKDNLHGLPANDKQLWLLRFRGTDTDDRMSATQGQKEPIPTSASDPQERKVLEQPKYPFVELAILRIDERAP